jgi:DNA-binding NarL/FixJ family response regulator
LKQIKADDWDLLILDISMPGKNGLEVLRALRPDHPKLPVLVLSVHAEEQYAMRAFKAGANGYMTKETAPDKLVEAVQQIMSGRPYVSVTMAERLVMELSSQGPRRWVDQLSDREMQVLRLFASGKTMTEIAHELGLSIKTVSTYRTRAMEKLGLRTNADLMRFAIEEGLG